MSARSVEFYLQEEQFSSNGKPLGRHESVHTGCFCKTAGFLSAVWPWIRNLLIKTERDEKKPTDTPQRPQRPQRPTLSNCSVYRLSLSIIRSIKLYTKLSQYQDATTLVLTASLNTTELLLSLTDTSAAPGLAWTQ